MILVVIILAVLVLMYLIVLGIFLADYDGILDDQIIKDYLDKLGDNYTTYIGEYTQRIQPTYSATVKKDIERSPTLIRLVFPYYIGCVGVVPIWSKSKSRIDAMFGTGIKRNFKRERLGLD
jgi:hypothetical protein